MKNFIKSFVHLVLSLKKIPYSPGVEILLFPANDVGPNAGTPEEVRAFAKDTMEITFNLMEMIPVNG